MMKGVVSWQGEVQFKGVSESGHVVDMDGPADSGGREAGFRPMELLLLGLGGCASFDTVTILKKARQQVLNCEVELEADRVDAVPSVFTRIHLHFVVTGISLVESHVARAIRLSAEKYCSASMMLEAGGVKISHSYEVKEGKAV